MSRDIKCFEWVELSAVSFSRDCMVERQDLCDSGAAAAGFRSGFRLGSDSFSRCGHERAFTYNYVKSHPKHAALHDLSATQSEAARSECVVHVKAANEANLQATNYPRHGSNTLQNGTQYQTHNSSFITHNSEENIIGRFLSPDPYIQAPCFAQNFDRYSYVWNNPLKYVDPSGYKTQPNYNWLYAESVRINAARAQYQGFCDWVYGRGLFGVAGPQIANMELQWLAGSHGGGAMIIAETNSGMLISTEPALNGEMITSHNGEYGVWMQASYWSSGGISENKHMVNGVYTADQTAPYLNVVCFFMDFSNMSGGEYYSGFTGNAWYQSATGLNGLVHGASKSAWMTSSSSVRLGSAEVESQKLLGRVTRTTKYLGWVGNAITIGDNVNNVVQNWGTDMQGYSNAKAIGSGIIVGVNALNCVLPGVGTLLSIGLGAADAAGAFDGIYEWAGGL